MRDPLDSHKLKIKFRSLLIVFFLTAVQYNADAQFEYPYNFIYNGNPLVRNHGAADPDAHVWDDTVWVYCSQDHEGGYSNMDGYHVFSSTDMINWTDHGDVFNSTMLNEAEWGSTPDHWMWAPGAARKQDENGKWTYYLYYPHNVRFDGQDWVTGVATAPTPAGPFTDQGPLKGGKMGMDPMVFIDNDGQAYIYSNSLIVAKLNPDMVSLAESPRRIEYAPEYVRNDNTLRFNEGSYMHKKDGIYYFSYSNFHNDDYQAFYAMGDNPYGPFEWQGPMAPNPRGAQDHHSLIDFQDQWYYFYHIAVPDYPEIRDGQSRIACYDRLYYNKDGTIQTVVHTYGPTHVIDLETSYGTVNFDPPGRSYSPGTVVTLTAEGDLGYGFDSWGGDLSGSENPITITMDNDKNIAATFVTVTTYKLTTSSSNGSISIDPPGGVYNEGTRVRLTAEGEFGYKFSSWSGDYTGSDNPIVINMDTNKNITANFVVVPTYQLTISSINGLVDLNPRGGVYEEGEEVKLEAYPDFGYEFTGWSGEITGTGNPVTITMDSDKTITAGFAYSGGGKIVFATNCGGPAYRSADGVNYSSDANNSGGGSYGTGSDISGTDDDFLYQSERFGNNFAYNISLPNGYYEVNLLFAEIFHSSSGQRIFNVSIENNQLISNLDLYSKVGKNRAYIESHWINLEDGQLNISLSTIKDNAKLSAIKILQPDENLLFSLNTISANGSVVLEPPGGEYAPGTEVNITANPDLGYRFVEWSGDLAGSENPASLTMISNMNVAAKYTSAPVYYLIVEFDNGTISMNPEGQIYTEGTTVSLSAVPDTGYQFSNWSGDLSGSENPVSVIMDGTKNITAIFSSNVSNSIWDDVNISPPVKTNLAQNYPNPFAEETIIPYRLKEPSHVTLSIFNFMGQEMECLVNEHQPAGYYKYLWNPGTGSGRQITDGLYIYSLETGKIPVQMRKLILMR